MTAWTVNLADATALIDEATALRGRARRFYLARAGALVMDAFLGEHPRKGRGVARWVRALEDVEERLASVTRLRAYKWAQRDSWWYAIQAGRNEADVITS